MHHFGIAFLVRSTRPAMTAALMVVTGLDEPIPTTLVHRLYDQIRADPMLGPIAAARVTDCEPHLARIVEFWGTVALMAGWGHGLVLSHICAAPSARLGHLTFEGHGAFPSQC